MSKVIVLGSINVDMVMETERFPQMGETILGNSIDYFMGGKGANQAVAASRVGAESILYGKVGDDTFGQKALSHLKAEKINMAFVSIEKNIFTGVASIFRINSDNSIVVLPGANMLLDQVDDLSGQINKEDIFLTQLEIPLETVEKGLRLARENGALTILNPAPFNEEIVAYLDLVDIITPNETEFEGMVGHAIKDVMLEAEMLQWSQKYQTKLIVTRGAAGVSYVWGEQVITVPVIDVEVMDTTGAGDTFNGILAAFLSKKIDYQEAIRLASIGASLSTTKIGAQTGMPTHVQLKEK